MKWTRVEKHWQELASKANAEHRRACPKPSSESHREPAAARSELLTKLDAETDEPPVDEQQTPDAPGESKQ